MAHPVEDHLGNRSLTYIAFDRCLVVDRFGEALDCPVLSRRFQREQQLFERQRCFNRITGERQRAVGRKNLNLCQRQQLVRRSREG
jgi:hypothetical protein